MLLEFRVKFSYEEPQPNNGQIVSALEPVSTEISSTFHLSVNLQNTAKNKNIGKKFAGNTITLGAPKYCLN